MSLLGAAETVRYAPHVFAPSGKEMTMEEKLEKTRARLERHRAQCRERYRRQRVALVQQWPHMFKRKQLRWLESPKQTRLTETHDTPRNDACTDGAGR